MSSLLSSEQINQLTPLLGSLARMLARGSQINDSNLETLLLGAGLEDSPTALGELRRWSRLLRALQQASTDEAQRHATVEALVLRGLPEAAVLLAVAMVADSSHASDPFVPPTPSAPKRLTASVSSLDFGSLGSGQPAALEFEVQGGPGQVSVESDQVQVTPGQFGAGPTRLRVELRPLASGLLWTSLKLVTASETLELPIIAQWQSGEAAPARLLLDQLTQPPQSAAAPPDNGSRQPLPLGTTQHAPPVQPAPAQPTHVPGPVGYPLSPQPQSAPLPPQPAGYVHGVPPGAGQSPVAVAPPTPARRGPGGWIWLLVSLIVVLGFGMAQGWSPISLGVAPVAPAAPTSLPLAPALIPELAEVPGGPFLMGSSKADPLAEEDEQPQHMLELPTYWIGKTEVTNAQFRPFVEGDGYTNRAYWDDAGWQWLNDIERDRPGCWDDRQWNGDNLPVVCVSWYEAMAYCRWLSAQTGQEFRLPTEAEWEKAVRGPDGRIWPWGDTWDVQLTNSAESGIGQTTMVGQYISGASPYGVLDMAGNAWEWTSSAYKEYPYNSGDGREDLRRPAETTFVLRGGSWFDRNPFNFRTADRLFLSPNYYDIHRNVGFRLAQNT